PVCLSYSNGSLPRAPISFDAPGTTILFPICPTLLAFGTFDRHERITRLDRRLVAKANLTMLQYCDRRLFAPHEQFEVNTLKPNDYVRGADVLGIVAGRVKFET